MVNWLITLFLLFLPLLSSGDEASYCEDQARTELLKLLKEDGKSILSKQYALTTLKLAKLNQDKDNSQDLDEIIKNELKQIQSSQTIKKLNSIYSKYGLNDDYQKVVENMQSTFNWKNKAKFYNKDISAFIILNIESDKKTDFNLGDAAIAWMADKLTSEQNSFNDMSTQVSFINGKIKSFKGLSKEELNKQYLAMSENLLKEIKKYIKNFSPEYLKRCTHYINTICNNDKLASNLLGSTILKFGDNLSLPAIKQPLLKSKLQEVLKLKRLKFSSPNPHSKQSKLFYKKVSIPTIPRSSLYGDMQRYKKEVNGKDDLYLLQSYHKNFIPSKYAVIDKQNQTMKIFDYDGQVLLDVSIDAKFPKSDKSPPGVGAGIFYLNSTYPDKYINLTNQKDRKVRLEVNRIKAECTSNNVCQSSQPDNMSLLYKYLKPSDPIYILPEEEGNTFLVKNGIINFTTLTTKSSYAEYNYSPRSNVCNPIRTIITEPSYNTETARSFVSTLAKEKATIMKMYNLDNDEYNELTKLAFGILGNETSFGTNKKYYIKEALPFVVSLAKGNGFNTNNNSRGPTQIKRVPKKIAKKYGVKKDTLTNPKHAAVATIGFLAEALVELKSKEKIARKKGLIINSLNRMDYIHYIYMGRPYEITKGTATPEKNIYFRQVKKYSEQLLIIQQPAPS